MEYIIISTLQLLGIAFHGFKKVNTLGQTIPRKINQGNLQPVFREWGSSLSVSALVLFADLFFHFIIDLYFPAVREMSITVPINLNMPLPRCLVHRGLRPGYGGQRLGIQVPRKGRTILIRQSKLKWKTTFYTLPADCICQRTRTGNEVELKTRFDVIRNETVTGANSKTRGYTLTKSFRTVPLACILLH